MAHKVKKGGTRTPKSVMGNQGRSIRVKPSHHMARPTNSKKFPQ